MGRSPREVLASHSSADLSEWQAFDAAYGLDRSGDARAGAVAAAVWNAAGGLPTGTGDGRRAATAADFFATLNQTTDKPNADVDVEDDTDGDGDGMAEAATRAMKNAFAMWGLRQTAATRAAARSMPEAN